MNVYLLLLILEMEGQRGFQTNHQDGNNVVTDGTRNTAKEDINLRLAEVK